VDADDSNDEGGGTVEGMLGAAEVTGAVRCVVRSGLPTFEVDVHAAIDAAATNVTTGMANGAITLRLTDEVRLAAPSGRG
jgi:hypothetical protein